MPKLHIAISQLNKLSRLSGNMYGQSADSDEIKSLADFGDVPILQDPVFRTMGRMISDFTEDQKEELLTLIWIGRGTALDFAQGMQSASVMRGDNIAEYLYGRPLHKYIPAGVEKLQQQGFEIT